MAEQSTYSFYLKHRSGGFADRITLTTDNASPLSLREEITSTLTEVCRQCIEEDDTGYFFEIEGSDLSFFEAQDNFYKVEVDGVEYGTQIYDLKKVG